MNSKFQNKPQIFLEQCSIVSKVILGCFGFALPRSVIGPENLRDLVNHFKPLEWLASNLSFQYHP